MQQDAHEFLNFLINHISEIILAERQQNCTTNNVKCKNVGENGTIHSAATEPTWVHEIFQVITLKIHKFRQGVGVGAIMSRCFIFIGYTN